MTEIQKDSPDYLFETPLDVCGIMKIIPHRFPFLLIDRIIEGRRGYCVAEKCVSINEPFFQGHFPERPLMPGVLLIECMAQAASVVRSAEPESEGKLGVFAGIESAKFRRAVVPGDVLRIEVTEIARKSNFGKCHGRITVNNELACEATMSFMLVTK